MSRIRIVGMVLLLSLSQPINAGLREDLEKNLRPLIEKYLGDSLANSLFGKKEEELTLPPIPKIVKNAKAVVVESEAETKDKMNLSEDELASYHAGFIKELYQVVLSQKASRNDISTWLNALMNGGSREGIYRNLVLGKVYLSMESMKSGITEGTVNFAQFILKEFINHQTTKEKLARLSVYTIKRLVTEKVLNVFDTLIRTNEDDAYRWYGVLSGKMASVYGGALGSNKIRVNPSSHFHYNWAKDVNVQMIKSELIIKIHKIFNTTIP